MKSVWLASALFLVLVTGLAAQENGTIEGRVVNGTTGNPAAGLEVTLTHFSMEPMPPRTATTDDEGGFRFEGLPMGPRHGYVVSVDYAEVTYTSEFWRALQGETQHSLELWVYEITDSDQALRIARSHHVVVPQVQGLAVLELLVLANPGNRTFVPAGGSIAVPLPEGAVDLQVTEGDALGKVTLEEGVLHIRTPLPPGERELIYTYRLPLAGDSFRWQHSITYPIEFYDLLLPAGAASVSSPTLSHQGTRQIEEESYDYWSGQRLQVGERLTIEFADLPTRSSSPAAESPGLDVQAMVRWAGVALAAAGVGLALVYPRYRQRGTSPATPSRREEG